MQFANWPAARICRRIFVSGLLLVSLAAVVAAQETSPETSKTQKQTALSQAEVRPSSSYVPVKLLIGAGDEIEISFHGVPDLNQKTRVGSGGEVNLPLAGEVVVAGMSAQEAATVIEAKYVEGGYLKSPHVSVFVKEYTTQNMTIAGEVAKPGVYQGTNSRRLLDLILAAGGLTERAGKTVTITHYGQPDKPMVVALSQDDSRTGASNIDLAPGDTVIVSRAGVVYVIGEVNRAGGFVMENHGSMTVSQALAKAAGPTRMASLNSTRVLRQTPTGLTNLDLPLKKILAAKAPDVVLQPEDIVFIPGSKGKMAVERTSGSVLSMLTGLAIYRF
ncbi:MAG TPA: polysaccharide biosynthesis/export family protein [Terriglobales bacterium]|nr:polysaccharide biosynthesis/export family protein [Terriglobales bacterium]